LNIAENKNWRFADIDARRLKSLQPNGANCYGILASRFRFPLSREEASREYDARQSAEGMDRLAERENYLGRLIQRSNDGLTITRR
jgi:hypothetical protein